MFNLTLHALAGVGALAMGGSVLVRDPSRPRNRWFALLCAALALWNLGFAARASDWPGSDALWTIVLLLGSCAAPPLALGFAGRLAAWKTGRRRRAVGVATIAAAAIWLAAWTSFGESAAWNYTAIAVLGGIFAAALFVVARRASTRPPGPERRALWWVFGGGAFAVVGGLSDFLPRDPRAFAGNLTEFGPIGVLAFLLVMAAVVVHHRFLDVDLFLLRTVALIAGATAVALVFHAALRFAGFDSSLGLLFLVALVVVALGGPLSRVLLSGARTWLTPSDTLATTLVGLSRNLADAETPDAVWDMIATAIGDLRGTARLRVFWSENAASYRLTFDSRPHATGDPPRLLSADAPMATLLDADRAPLTERFLEQEAAESGPLRAATSAAVLEQFRADDLRLVVPLLRGGLLVGWVEISGGWPDRYLTAEVAAAFMAVGQQAADTLDRIAANAIARRREKLAALGELSAGLAHEVRNPVAAIRGAAQASGTGATPEQRSQMLEVIQEETARLERVVAEFLDYARPTTPRREPVTLETTVQRVLQGATLAGWTLETRVAVAPDTPAVLADPDQLQRVFENLVRNTWEATGAGGRLDIDIRPAGDDLVAVRFEDNGPGIAPERLSHIFTPFHTTKAGGTGLGLALVHSVIEAHGGEVRVEGREGLGAAFTIVLTAAPPAP